VIDDGNAVAQLVRFIHIVSRQKNRQVALRLDLPQHLPDRHARYRIQPGCRFVEKKNARLVHQAAGDLHTPPHAARKILNRFIAPLCEFHRI
jgi:hypothetical protein